MKKNIFYAGAFMCAMAALSSCSNEVLDSSLQQDGKLSVTAGMGMDSRTAVEDELNSEGEYDIVWSGADKIYLFGNKSYAEMSLVSGAGESEAQFDGRIYGYASRLKHAIYPVPTVNGDGTFGLELGAEYDYSSNSNAPMFGSYEDGYVTFGLMTAMSRINVDVEAGDEVELIMKGADGNPVIIAGEATISSTGVLTLANDGEKSVKVTFDEAGNFMLDVPVPVGQYKGYTVKLNGEVIADKTLDAAVPLTPGQILVASSAEEPEAATPDSDEYELSTAAQLRWFAEQVNTGNTFAGKLIKLAGDIDLKNIPWTPVGNGATGAVSFRGTFDGQDHVISNIMINEGASAFDGFFGSVWGATIQNLVLEGVSVETGRLVARVNGDLASSTTAISNVTVNGSEVDNLIGKIENAAIVTIDGNKFIADGVLAKGMDENELGIYSHKGLMWFVDQVNNLSNNFAGKTVTLGANIDLDNMPWTPISGFKGTFDGAKFTISNLNVAVEGTASAGLFADGIGATIKNLKLQNVNVNGNWMTGAIIGDGSCVTILNCHVNGGSVTSTPHLVGGKYDDGNHAGGIVGLLTADGGNASVTGCSVTGLTISAYRDVAGIAGTASGDGYIPTISNNEVSYTTIIADQTVDYVIPKAANAGEIVGRKDVEPTMSGNTVGEGVSVGTLVATAEKLNYAINTVSNGQTIVLANGTYEGLFDLTGKNLTIQAANKEQAIINGLVWANNCTVTLKGLKLTNKDGVKHPNPTNSQYYNTINNQYPLIGAYLNAAITVEECTLDLEGPTVYGFYGYANNTPVFKNSIFNCNKIRPIANNGAAITVTGCTFNDQYHYSVRIFENSGAKQTVVFTYNTIKGSNDMGEFEGINISKKGGTATILADFTIKGNTNVKYRHHEKVTMSSDCTYDTDIVNFAFEKEN